MNEKDAPINGPIPRLKTCFLARKPVQGLPSKVNKNKNIFNFIFAHPPTIHTHVPHPDV